MSTIAQEIQPPIRGYVSAFNFFEREVRDRIVMQNPILKVIYRTCDFAKSKCICNVLIALYSQHNDHNKIVGDMWKKLKPNEKRKYDEMADADKIRYLKVCLLKAFLRMKIGTYVLKILRRLQLITPAKTKTARR
jgi:hypothetical protein